MAVRMETDRRQSLIDKYAYTWYNKEKLQVAEPFLRLAVWQSLLIGSRQSETIEHQEKSCE